MGFPNAEMSFQANRQRKGFSSAHCDSGKNIIEDVRRSVISRRTTDEIKAAICSSRLKHLQFECFKDDEKELYFPAHTDEKRKQGSVVQLPLSKHSEKQTSTQKKFRELKVYRSFMEEEEAADMKRSKNANTSEKKNTAKVVTTRNTEGTPEAAHPSRVTYPSHAVRRYALYRGMLSQ